ncbi:hypothetical protein [Agrobacterium tumefaciens]|uniref:hypothetical protein n=1 Tax=Agrobacterium tumefaciens TaxID=358 RepID=UPI003BA3C7C6
MKPAGFWDWLGPLLLMGMFIAYLFFTTPIEPSTLRINQDWIREWFGALSGWVAAGAAATTIGSLRRQAKAAKKQTDFQLGDALPTLDAVQHTEQSGRAVIRIRNWNRRSMIIRRITVIKPENTDATLFLFFNPDSYPDLASKFGDLTLTGTTSVVFDPALLVEGWVKREQEPTLMKFGISVYVGNSLKVAGWDKFSVTLDYELVGETDTKRIDAHIHVVSGASSLDQDLFP